MPATTPVTTPVAAPVPVQSPTVPDGSSAPTPDASAPQPAAQTSATETKTDAPTTTSAPQTSSQPAQKATPQASVPKGRVSIGGLGLALSLELFVKPGIKQPDLFPTATVNQELPEAVRVNQDFLLDLLRGEFPSQSNQFKKLSRDAVELEQ